MKVSKISEMVSGKPLPEWKKQLKIEIAATNQVGQEVDTPFVIININ